VVTRYADSGDVRIAYEDLGGSGGEPLLLVMGLGTSRAWWPAGFVAALVEQGFHVVSYDQRDSGESTHFSDHDAGIALARRISSPGYPFDEAAARAAVEREIAAGGGIHDAGAQGRQTGAPWNGGRLADLHTPTLVLHGEQDPVVRPSAARATAAAVPDARLVLLPGVGHDLPEALWPLVTGEVRAVAERAEASHP
jgi:pimeloyl-ACP methyl ester carboxylesterase